MMAAVRRHAGAGLVVSTGSHSRRGGSIRRRPPPRAASRRLLDDPRGPARSAAIGPIGRALIERHLTWDRVARDFAALSRSASASAGRS
jgi:hypothetical protein